MANTDSTTLERALRHASSGRYITIYEIRKQLVAEGYSLSTISGKAIQRQLIALIRAARPPGEGMHAEALSSPGSATVNAPDTPFALHA